MKRTVSLLTALIMIATVIAFPMADKVYGETETAVVNNELQDNTESGEDLDGGENIDDGESLPGDNEGESEDNDSDVDLTDIASDEITAAIAKTSYKYTGNEIKPVPVVKHTETTLIENTDYTVTYANCTNAGTAQIIIEGVGEYTGRRELNFKISPVSLSSAYVTLSDTNYFYKGYKRTPAPTVELNGKKLKKGVDYEVSYSNSLYPGTATVKVTGINNYKSYVSKKFYIAQMGNLALKSRGATSLKLGWNKRGNVTGYQIYIYDTSEDKWVWKKTVKGYKNTITTVTDLKEGYTHKLKIRTYVKDSDGDLHYGSFGPVVSFATKPGKVTISKLSSNIKMQLIVKWKKERGNGYQVAVSRKSGFSDPAIYNIKESSVLSKTIQAGKDDVNYYVKVRAYKIINGKKVYGAWSKVKKVRVDGDGWGTINGRKYYCRNGKPYKGNHTIAGNPYFFGRNSGALMGVNHKMYRKVQDEKSRTKYLIAVSRTKNRLCIYEKNKGEWVVKYYWKCSTGAPGLISPISKTPAGYYNVPKRTSHKLHFGEESGYTCWYATRIKKGYYFHSVLYNPYSKTSIQDGRLGYNVSHGCVRLSLKNAKWMYDNIDAGTRIVIMN